jgi:hypothetical protein
MDVPNGEVMKTLKGYVQNIAWPKGSMAIRYAIKEAMGFYIEYILQVKSTRRRV